MLAYKLQQNTYQMNEEIKGYARTLYNNYRARCFASGQPLPQWRLASPVIKREFIRNARIELGYE